MNHRFFQLKTFVTYWLDALTEHSLHSPFFFEFYSKTLKATDTDNRSPEIETLRQLLLKDRTIVNTEDFGAGSTRFQNSSRAIGDIAKTSLSPRKYSQLYERIIRRFDNPVVLELGTSLGINTLYLASSKQTRVITFEGSTTIAETAEKNFTIAGADNIKLVLGNIENTLPIHLESIDRLDFVFMDANHRFTPTIHYFRQLIDKAHTNSVFVLDDIHYSPEMENAWNTIKKNKGVYATADLYRCGIVFFDPSLNNQHLVLQF